MDISCAKCGEPWDTYHLIHDEVWETEAGQLILTHQRIFGEDSYPENVEPWNQRLTSFWKCQFQKLGWKFASNCIVAPIQCTCCKDESPREIEGKYGLSLAEEYAAVASLMGDDLDGIISEFGE